MNKSQTGGRLAENNNSQVDYSTLEERKTKYALKGYKVFFSTKLARQYEPIVYSAKCRSGDPRAVYYRILKNDKNDFCIQYFYYWYYQNCILFTSHRYDYEPIFIYIKSDDSNPYIIVNGGFGGLECNLHKNEVRPRNSKRDNEPQHVPSNLSPYPFYPFGGDGKIEYHACVSIYPLDTGDDLQFEEKQNRPLFGIPACSNVFSGAKGYLYGHRFNPPLRKLTDKVLENWYFHHYKNSDDMPFGHDIADPFSFPYIKFHKPSIDEIMRFRKQKR